MELPMEDISETDLKQWQVQMEKQGLSHTTIKRAFGAFRTMLRHAVRENFLLFDPTHKFQLQKPTDDEIADLTKGEPLKKRRILSSDELIGIRNGLTKYQAQLIQQRDNSRSHGKSDLPNLNDLHYPH